MNYEPHKAAGAPLPGDAHVDYFMADSPIECHRDHLDLDGFHVKALTMKEPPAGTFAHILEDLYTVPGEFIACLEWSRIANDRVRRDLQMRRRHFFNRRVSLVNYVSPDTRPEEMLVDESASATVRQLGDALTKAPPARRVALGGVIAVRQRWPASCRPSSCLSDCIAGERDCAASLALLRLALSITLQDIILLTRTTGT